MGPPIIFPYSSTFLYFTARTASLYLVAIPKKPVIHIQNNAPGPPTDIAPATPAILPVPTVPASAVISAWKCEISPSPLFPSSFLLINAKYNE